MSITVDAIYENGAFRPWQPLPLELASSDYERLASGSTHSVRTVVEHYTVFGQKHETTHSLTFNSTPVLGKSSRLTISLGGFLCQPFPVNPI